MTSLMLLMMLYSWCEQNESSEWVGEGERKSEWEKKSSLTISEMEKNVWNNDFRILDHCLGTKATVSLFLHITQNKTHHCMKIKPRMGYKADMFLACLEKVHSNNI